jgi:uncharacterized protein YifE (UPF0438 family)
MQDLTQEEVALLRPHLKALVALAEGRRLPATEAQRRFVESVNGLREPASNYEIAYSKWQRTKPDLDELPSGNSERQNSSRGKKKRRRGKSASGMSVAKAKASRTARWTEKEIIEHHRKSGYHKVKAVILRGGAVNPR